MIEEVEALLDRVEEFPEPQREITTELVQALLDMYGEGLSRIVAACDVPVEDELVAHLLLLHGLHPVPVRERVLSARWTRSGPTWPRTAAGSSCSGSRTASCGCGSRGPATAVPRRR